MNSMNSHIDKIQSSILNAYKIGITLGNPEKYQDLSAFEKQIKELCELEQGFLKEPKIIADLPNVEIKSLDAIYKKMVKEQLRSDPMDSDRYRSFEKNIEDIKNSLVRHTIPQAQNMQVPMATRSGNDLEVDKTENKINFVDPITKKMIKNPVRNKICNHIYDLESINALIKTSHMCRCPYIGCSGPGYLAIENLIEDRDLKRKIMQNEQDSYSN